MVHSPVLLLRILRDFGVSVTAEVILLLRILRKIDVIVAVHFLGRQEGPRFPLVSPPPLAPVHIAGARVQPSRDAAADFVNVC
jgi:hypothetical protein